MSYFLTHNLCMYGGDIRDKTVNGYGTAVETAKEMINGDFNRCATIKNIGGGKHQIFLKNSRAANPSKTNDHDRVTIFFGNYC